MKIFKTKFRIVADNYAGYEVQFRYWWFPFWVQADLCNTHTTAERAEKWAREKYGLPIKTFTI